MSVEKRGPDERAAGAGPTLEWAPPRGLEVPRVLPVSSLSVSSLQLAERCFSKWKTHYIDGERSAQNLRMTCGKAFGATMAHYFAERIGGRSAPSVTELDDRLVCEFDEELAGAEVGADEDPAAFRESCREPLRAYATEIAPTLRPVAIERRVRFAFAECEWTISGYLDLETEDDGIVDLKLGSRHIDGKRLANDLQPTCYLLAKRLEGAASPQFSFHSGRRGQIRSGERWRVLAAPRTERQLVGFQYRVARIARQIVQSVETGDWATNPDGFWCAADCPAWRRCPAGGLR